MSVTLLEQWRNIAYDQSASNVQMQQFWGSYFMIEKDIYEQLLTNPDEEVKGTVKELAEKYGQEVMTMVGFLDGINDSLVTPNPIETMDEDTVVSLAFDKGESYGTQRNLPGGSGTFCCMRIKLFARGCCNSSVAFRLKNV